MLTKNLTSAHLQENAKTVEIDLLDVLSESQLWCNPSDKKDTLLLDASAKTNRLFYEPVLPLY